MKWTEADIGDQTGRTVVITGANSGLGLQAARVLGERGARVLLACRSREKGERAASQVRGGELVLLDVAELDSVRAVAAKIRTATGDRLDLLINNAGIAWAPLRRTAQGHESTFATNHLGHAALTWLLMPALRGGTDARVVHVSSLAAVGAGIDLADPNALRQPYSATASYSQSKLANLCFALELDRRLRTAGDPVRSLVAHPGLSGTELFANSARQFGRIAVALSRAMNAVITQSIAAGTRPVLYAATAAQALQGSGYYGPDGPLEARGRGVRPARIPAVATAEPIAAALWDLTAKLTGVTPDPS